MADGTSLEKLQFQVGQWASSTFSKATNETIIAHLKREIEELDIATIHAKTNTGLTGIGEEAADCVLLILHLCERNRIDLAYHIKRKHWRNQRRTWGEPDAQGVVEHIAEAGGA